MLGHFQTGDFVVSAGRHGYVAVIHAQDPALGFFDACFAQRVVAPRGLVPSEGDSRGVCPVIGAGVFGKRPPTASDVE